MSMRPLVLPIFLLPGVASADVTPQDVWDNMVAGYAAVGIELTATLDTTGETLIANDGVATLTYPVIGGGITATLPPMTLTDQGDGTVAISTPGTYVSEITADIPEENQQASLDLTIAMGEVTSFASGDPGDVVYRTAVKDFDMLLSNLVVPDVNGSGTLTGQFESEGYESVTRIVISDNVMIDNIATNLPSVFSFTVEDGETLSESKGTGGILNTTFNAVIPQDTDIMNLSAALANGLSVNLTTANEGGATETTTIINGDVFSSQSQVTKASESTFNFDAAGLRSDGTSEGGSFDMNAGGFMPPISVSFGPASGAFAMPVMGKDTPQPYRLQLSMSDIAVADNLWDMIDQGGALDRSPATISFDINGELTNPLDVFSPDTMAMLDQTGTLPIEPNTLNITDLVVAALGAELTANGAFAFDNMDLQTFGGLPRPEGKASARGVGLNSAIDQLVASGLVSEQDIGMGRMFMGMFAVQQGDDDLTTELEVNAEGHVILNGQRIQ